jgi:ferredoxin
MRIVVTWPLCDGNGLCAREAPNLLKVDDQDQLHVLQETFGEEDRQRAQAAVRVCPKAALSIEE